MSGMLIWQFISYAMVLSLGTVAVSMGNYWLAALVLLGFPAWRIWRRFKPDVGYLLVGDHALLTGPGAEGRRVTFNTHPTHFKLYLVFEVAIILGILALYLYPR